MTTLSLRLIRVYQATLAHVFRLFSPCRFAPHCSEYGYGVIERFGWRRGWWLAVRRVGRCHPFAPGGYDPVPENYIPFLARRRRGGPVDPTGEV